jgi:hypothetical protein
LALPSTRFLSSRLNYNRLLMAGGTGESSRLEGRGILLGATLKMSNYRRISIGYAKGFFADYYQLRPSLRCRWRCPAARHARLATGPIVLPKRSAATSVATRRLPVYCSQDASKRDFATLTQGHEDGFFTKVNEGNEERSHSEMQRRGEVGQSRRDAIWSSTGWHVVTADGRPTHGAEQL